MPPPVLQIRIKRAIKTAYHQFPKSLSSLNCADSLELTGQWNLAQNYEFQVSCSVCPVATVVLANSIILESAPEQ